MRSLLLLLAAACGTAGTTDLAQDPAAPATQDARMAWWRDARFGMFIHWGLYAIPAGEWQGNKNHGEWIRDTARIPVGTYDRFQQQWQPSQFDADAWARLAAAAGMKYLVVTSKHHDGFCLWDSQQTDWDVGNTPDGRDILQALADACARHGVRFCTYHSIMDWHHPDYLPRRPWEAQDRPTTGADFDRFEGYLHAQVTELVQRYRPAVMWFDGEWENTWNHERGVRLFELCRSLDPRMIVNNRVDVHRGGMQGFSQSDQAVGDFATPEQEIPATGLPGVDWESCMTMNRHWGFNAADSQWKSTTQLLRNLIDIASKGGNYLLNVGPKADGKFPDEAVQRLQQIGDWMRRNGTAIHGTTASVFDALPFGRCTVRAGKATSTLYLHVFDWPQDRELVLPGLGNDIVRAYALSAPATRLPAVRDGNAVRIRVPATVAIDPHATVIALEVEGQPIVYRTPTIHSDSSEFVTSLAATIGAASPGIVVRYTLDGSEVTAASPIATAPLSITASCTVRARGFHKGQPVTSVATATFTKVKPYPPVEPVAPNQGLRVARYDVDWISIPDNHRELPGGSWSTSESVTAGKAPGERVALRFQGFLDVPQDELYRFALASDDGSKLWIDGQLVVDNDGLHGTVERTGTRALGAGLHPIEVVWFNRTGGAELSLRWALPGQPFAPIPSAALRH